MSKLRKTLVSTAASLAALGVAASAALAHGSSGNQQGPHRGGMMGQMGQGMMGGSMMQGMPRGGGPGMQSGGQGMGPGMMQGMPGGGGPGMQGAPGQGMGPGMMRGMPGEGGQGMMGGQGASMRVTPMQHLTTDDVCHFLEHRLEVHGNDRLKVGEVQEVDDDTITAEVVTVDDSLVQRWRVDRHTGQMQPYRSGGEEPQPQN